MRTGFDGARSRRRVLCSMAFGACLALATLSLTRAQQFSEYDVKAAFLFNFAKFVEWPDQGTTGPLKLCLLGSDPFGDALSALEGKRVQGRLLQTRRDIDEDAATSCHILFVNELDKRRLLNVLRKLQHLPVLTVSDSKDFAEIGGIIGFITVDNRIQFEINLEAAQKARLRISSQLLKLARLVKAGK